MANQKVTLKMSLIYVLNHNPLKILAHFLYVPMEICFSQTIILAYTIFRRVEIHNYKYFLKAVTYDVPTKLSHIVIAP